MDTKHPHRGFDHLWYLLAPEPRCVGSRRNRHHDNTNIEANKELVRTYSQTVFNEHHTEHASDFLAR
jgi:hypothetical protein